MQVDSFRKKDDSPDTILFEDVESDQESVNQEGLGPINE